jgi:hypothetical protein
MDAVDGPRELSFELKANPATGTDSWDVGSK